MPPRGNNRPPCYTPHAHILADIPADIPAGIEAQEPAPIPAYSRPPISNPPRPAPPTPSSAVPAFLLSARFNEEPRPHLFLQIHIRYIVTIEGRIHVLCVATLIVSYLLYRTYILVCSLSYIQLLPGIPFFSAIIAVAICLAF